MTKPVSTPGLRRACLHVQIVAPLVLALAFCSATARAQTLTFAGRAGGAGADRGVDIAVDGEGHRYVTGIYEAGARFGDGSGSDVPVGAWPNGGDVFVAKYDAIGALLWLRSAGGAGSDAARAITIDALGNSYVVGTFEGVASFGGGEARFTQLVAEPLGELFVAKYGPDGSLAWAKQTAGSNSRPIGDEAADVAVDAGGNVYVTGTFNGSSIFGFGEPNRTTLTSTRLEVFVAKYAPDGQLLWAKQARGTVDDIGASIAVDAAGAAYVTGYFRDRITLGAGEPGETTLATEGVESAFVAKYDASGALVWAKSGTSPVGSAAEGVALAVDEAGGVVVGGNFVGTLVLEGAAPLDEGGSFIAHYDALGTLTFARAIAGDDVTLHGLAVDARRDVHAAGSFGADAAFGVGERAGVTLTPHDGADGTTHSDAFVARYAPDGALRWALGVGGTGNARFEGIAADGPGKSHVIGAFDGSVTLEDDTQRSEGGEDVVFASYEDVAPIEPITLDVRVRALSWTKTLRHIPGEQSALTLDNGRRGLRALWVIANGRLHWLVPLRDGRRYRLDLSRSLKAGDRNVITLVGLGAFGARAKVTLAAD